MVKNPPAKQETQVPSLGREDPLEEDVAAHCSSLAWRIPCTEEPGGLQFTRLQKAGHDGSVLVRARARTHTHTHTHSLTLSLSLSLSLLKILPR